MRVAMSSYSGMGAWFVLRLMAEGHDVDYYLSDAKYEDVLRGLIPKPKMLELDHRRHSLGYGHPNYRGYDLSLFDLTGRPKQAEASKLAAPTLGDGQFEHLLEDDREFGLSAMEQCGIDVPPYQRFDKPAEAKVFITKENKKFVYKPFTIGGQTQDTATTYVSKSAEDLLKAIDKLFEASKRAPFILQEVIDGGVEIGIEGFFNGTSFFLLTGTLEEKKFMNDRKGPNTGCGGNLIFTLRDSARIYEEGLKKAIPMLSSMGFRGILDLNSIVKEGKFYALEWTPRFGYLCCPTIAHMYSHGYGNVLHAIASGKTPLLRWKWEFGGGVTFTIPPYPSEIRLLKSKGIPIEGIDPKDLVQLCEYYLYDVRLAKDRKSLETSGNYGYVGAAIAGGNTIDQAFDKVDERIDRVQVPNMQYRTDIRKCVKERYEQLLRDSWL